MSRDYYVVTSLFFSSRPPLAFPFFQALISNLRLSLIWTLSSTFLLGTCQDWFSSYGAGAVVSSRGFIISGGGNSIKGWDIGQLSHSMSDWILRQAMHDQYNLGKVALGKWMSGLIIAWFINTSKAAPLPLSNVNDVARLGFAAFYFQMMTSSKIDGLNEARKIIIGGLTFEFFTIKFRNLVKSFNLHYVCFMDENLTTTFTVF